MTFTQIEKTKDFMSRLGNVKGLKQMLTFAAELRSFYTDSSLRLDVFTFNTAGTYTEMCEQKDRAAIKSFLDSKIAEDDNNKKALDILDLIEEGNKSIGNDTQMVDFISKVFYFYNNEIKFDKTTEAVAIAPPEALRIGVIQADENMVNGIINKLKYYGMSLLSQPFSLKTKPNPTVVINNSNTNSATASANTDIKITIEYAKQRVEDAGFGDQQYESVMNKLAEIESIGKSTDTKGVKWKKAKEILKWCAEQGIEIAKIVLPILPQILDK